jgi:1,4-alpha-glucan branching enzyme
MSLSEFTPPRYTEEVTMNEKVLKQKEVVAKQDPSGAGTVFVCDPSPHAREVYHVGEFNNWNPRADRMTKTKNGFRRTLQLPPGEYQYKFLVDGHWHNDPSALKQVPNAFGTTNSVVRVGDASRK